MILQSTNLTSAILNPMGILHIAVLADIQNIPICVIFFFPNFKNKIRIFITFELWFLFRSILRTSFLTNLDCHHLMLNPSWDDETLENWKKKKNQ